MLTSLWLLAGNLTDVLGPMGIKLEPMMGQTPPVFCLSEDCPVDEGKYPGAGGLSLRGIGCGWPVPHPPGTPEG